MLYFCCILKYLVGNKITMNILAHTCGSDDVRVVLMKIKTIQCP